jgi:hypothetical protein
MLTPPIPLHLSGPPDESAQLAVSIRPRADPASGESWFGRVSLRESTHKRQPLTSSAYRHRAELTDLFSAAREKL